MRLKEYSFLLNNAQELLMHRRKNRLEKNGKFWEEDSYRTFFLLCEILIRREINI
jgi:hypothetical protein